MKEPAKPRQKIETPIALGFQACLWQFSWGGGLGTNVSRLDRDAGDGMQRTLVNVGQDTTLCDCDVAQKLVQFLIVSDGELEMSGNDTGLLVVASGITSEFKDFSCEILEDGGEVDWSTSTNTLSVVALPQQTMNTANWKSETSF
jgi:hypothetical protein